MGLETGTRIEDLVSTNPVAGDDVSEGRNHLNLIKTCVKGSFPSLGATAVSATAEQLNLLTSPETNLVTSWNGRVGPVVPNASDYDLADLGDTYTFGQADYDNLTYNGTYWVPTPTNKSIATLNTTGSQTLGETLLIPDGVAGVENAANHIQLRIYDLAQTGTTGSIFIELGDTSAYSMTSEGATYGYPNSPWTSNDGAGIGAVSGDGYFGIVDLYLQSGTNRWIVSGAIGPEAGVIDFSTRCNGYITLSGPADRLRITSSINNFDSGSVDVRVTC